MKHKYAYIVVYARTHLSSFYVQCYRESIKSPANIITLQLHHILSLLYKNTGVLHGDLYYFYRGREGVK